MPTITAALQRVATVAVATADTPSVLHLAASVARLPVAVFRALLAAPGAAAALAMTSSPSGDTILHTMALYDCVGGMSAVLRSGMLPAGTVRARNAAGVTPLRAAITSSHPGSALLLMTNGADVNEPPLTVAVGGGTLLHEALRAGATDIVLALLTAGAHVDVASIVSVAAVRRAVLPIELAVRGERSLCEAGEHPAWSELGARCLAVEARMVDEIVAMTDEERHAGADLAEEPTVAHGVIIALARRPFDVAARPHAAFNPSIVHWRLAVHVAGVARHNDEPVFDLLGPHLIGCRTGSWRRRAPATVAWVHGDDDEVVE